ncbi:MAG TPA: SDR family NAD(P)-dependent oxidoreductase [Solirubrobacteraceae bacterium]|jgi:NAD(P)-dependent dehydrogenase (short-subunit alcohol dehydrogenase family)|nr:SDR family NAD(P)-dependent oxidoreductase [Solirubrobacteraceae bacterium]
MRKSTPTPLAGRTAVISGAGSGIGRSLAQRLSLHGCPLALADADGATLAETAALLDGPKLTRVLDVRDRDGQLAFAAEVRDWSGAPIGAVFNNAGVGFAAPFAAGSSGEEERLMSINFDGVVNGVRAFLPILLEQCDGAIVNTSSIYGLAGLSNQTAYCASKFAVRGFTDALRQELAGTGVRAITVYPGGVKTNIVANAHVHADLDDGRSAEELTAEFHARARTTPEQAAAIIHAGVDRGRARILIGPDARLFDVLERIAPTQTMTVLGALERLGHRRSA